jgi:predicted DNA-binding antitoxin AbrB/MazE fold protein
MRLVDVGPSMPVRPNSTCTTGEPRWAKIELLVLVGRTTAHPRRPERVMTVTVDATHENGALKLSQPLPLREHEKVRVTIEVEPCSLLRPYGIMRWKGDAETIERAALGPDFDPVEE